MTPTGHDELKEQQGWATRALNAEARVEELEIELEYREDAKRLVERGESWEAGFDAGWNEGYKRARERWGPARPTTLRQWFEGIR